MVGCDGWGINATDPPMRWDDHPAHRQKPIKTSFPLLFVSNTADPVTPLYAGVKMAQKFVDAGLVEQLSEGHCSLSALSFCTTKAVVNYFLKGEVPSPPKLGKDGDLKNGEWLKCERNSWPFQDTTAQISAGGEEQAENAKLFKNWKGFGEKILEMQFYGQKPLPPMWRKAAMEVYRGSTLLDFITAELDAKM